jgi:hypothetical protein
VVVVFRDDQAHVLFFFFSDSEGDLQHSITKHFRMKICPLKFEVMTFIRQVLIISKIVIENNLLEQVNIWDVKFHSKMKWTHVQEIRKF